MGILTRFTDIISSNLNALLDKAEDPAKMIDQYLRKLSEDLADVKRETAGVMAEESRTKRLLDENANETAKYEGLAKKALIAGNDDDARVFLSKKHESEAIGAGLETTYAAARENAIKMRQLHDKLVKDMNSMNNRRQLIKAKVAVARTQNKVNKIGASSDKMQSSAGDFKRMEDKADQMLDQSNAMADLDAQPVDQAQSLANKYNKDDIAASVEDELTALKAKMGL
ncbi:MAG: PspA/IM30 family protein [Bacillota bacterium]|nr:PspA/IM30 family protein [Bacillota bacterium]